MAVNREGKSLCAIYNFGRKGWFKSTEFKPPPSDKNKPKKVLDRLYKERYLSRRNEKANPEYKLTKKGLELLRKYTEK